MRNDTLFEKGRLRDRFKEIFTLAAFTIAIAFLCLVTMNLLIYPLTIFAVKYKNAFNIIFKNIFILGIITLLVALILVTTYRLHNRGLTAKEIVQYIIRKPFYYMSISLFFIAVSALIIWLLYFMFSNNYYLLYKITK